MKGKVAWNKGISPSRESINKGSLSRIGTKRSAESVEKTRQWHLGSKRTPEQKENMRQSQLKVFEQKRNGTYRKLKRENTW